MRVWLTLTKSARPALRKRPTKPNTFAAELATSKEGGGNVNSWSVVQSLRPSHDTSHIPCWKSRKRYRRMSSLPLWSISAISTDCRLLVRLLSGCQTVLPPHETAQPPFCSEITSVMRSLLKSPKRSSLKGFGELCTGVHP